MMLGTDFPENILPDDDGLSFLDAVTPILSAPDVTFGNLEGVLRTAASRSSSARTRRSASCSARRPATPRISSCAGFDVLSLANNHARDFGEEGRASMAALDAVGIHHSGREGTVASWIANGRRVALVAFAPNVGSNQLNDPQIARAWSRSWPRARHRDRVVPRRRRRQRCRSVAVRARDLRGEDRGNVVEFAHAMIDAGADIVLGHGPHVVRPWSCTATG